MAGAESRKEFGCANFSKPKLINDGVLIATALLTSGTRGVAESSQVLLQIRLSFFSSRFVCGQHVEVKLSHGGHLIREFELLLYSKQAVICQRWTGHFITFHPVQIHIEYQTQYLSIPAYRVRNPQLELFVLFLEIVYFDQMSRKMYIKMTISCTVT